MTDDVKLEPSSKAVRRIAYVLWLDDPAHGLLADLKAGRYDAQARAILAMDRRASLPAPAVAMPEGCQVIYQHVKRGTKYELLGIGKMQAEGWTKDVEFKPGHFEAIDLDMREVAVYRSLDDGQIWVRPREEFEDGRFEQAAAASEPPAIRSEEPFAYTTQGWIDTMQRNLGSGSFWGTPTGVPTEIALYRASAAPRSYDEGRDDGIEVALADPAEAARIQVREG